MVEEQGLKLRRDRNRAKKMAEGGEHREGNIDPGEKSMCERIAMGRLGKQREERADC